jgi:superfamily II DNA or RNA helicase
MSGAGGSARALSRPAGDDGAREAVRIDGNLALVSFDRFDLESYRRFLACKKLPESQVSYDWRADTYTLSTPARFAERLGADVRVPEAAPLPLAGHLFDYQRWITELALGAKRFAVWADTGLGKTPILLEWARQVGARTGGRVLILQPLQIIAQTVEMARQFYGGDLIIDVLDSREVLAAWCTASGDGLAICNYEKLIPGVLPEFRHLAGLVCDESSVLKSGGGVIKWNLIKSARGIEYKLSLTATPAPNDTMEYASQASFLEKLRTEGEILWTYFVRDNKTNEWRVKPHARSAFYAFMASWSVYLRNPAHFGFADILSSLPPPVVREYELPLVDAQREMMHGILGPKGGLFNDDRLTLAERSKLAQIARGFLYDTSGGKRLAVRYPSAKPPMVADLTAGHVAAGHQVLVWTVFDEEGEIVAGLLPDAIKAAVLSGKQSDTERAELIRSFKAGEIDVLISKAQLIGYGLNFQNCRAMVFSGFDDSFERMYQSVRRAYRFGQTETVYVDIPVIPELEGTVFGNVRRKQARFDEDTAIQERHYRQALMGA